MSDRPGTQAIAAPVPLVGVFPRLVERSHGPAHYAQACLEEAVLAAGGVPACLAPTCDPAALQAYLERFDGFIVPGGGDIDPSLYGEERLPACGPAQPERDAFEAALVPLILAADKPLLCICRGQQVLNVARGGTLWQDMPSQPASTPVRVEPPICHAHRDEDPFDLVAHTVAVRPGTLLERIASAAAGGPGACLDALPVNSMHHQGVHRLGEGLAVNAYAPDGSVEGIEMPARRFVLAVQWHPEFLWQADPVERAVFDAFVEACREG